MVNRDFERDVAPFRPALLAHCYRMTGSRSDADDALQDAMVRAWKAYDRFEERSSLRTWLYRIVTNACLDLIAARRSRTLPEHVCPPHTMQPSDDDPPWLEPFSDALLPDDALATRRAVRLAFVVALQTLPPKQRAALILRDVVGLSAEETAEALELTVAAVNSALQRARATVDARVHEPAPADEASIAATLARYVSAWESGDAHGLIALLRADAVLSMPPLPLWVRGPDAISALLANIVFPLGRMTLVPTRANGTYAFEVATNGVPASLQVVELDGDRIASITSFLTARPSDAPAA